MKVTRINNRLFNQLSTTPAGWLLTCLVIFLLIILPVLILGLVSVGVITPPLFDLRQDFVSSLLPRYFKNTLFLMATVGILSAALGTVTAWLVVMYRFPLRALFQWALFLPLAVPSYLTAYTWVDFFEYAGPVQTTLRSLFGWSSSKDYWFPEVRSLSGAIVLFTMSLFPYVYFLTRLALRDQSVHLYDAARTLGTRMHWCFYRLGLPLARPAVVAGATLVMMEVIADFGTVEYFAVPTMTTGIFTLWLVNFDELGASQLACLMMFIVICLVFLEKSQRRKMRFYQTYTQDAHVVPMPLSGMRAVVAMVVCGFPVVLGFLLPSAVIVWHSLRYWRTWIQADFWHVAIDSIVLAGGAAGLTVVLALLVVYTQRLYATEFTNALMNLTTVGYALPGAVLGLGLLLMLTRFDHALADVLTALTGHSFGLLLTGTTAAIVYAYVIRFFALSVRSIDAALERIPQSIPLVAATLGCPPKETLWRVYIPMIKRSLCVAVLLVFVDCIKELPATLLLRPFNFQTLALQVYEHASLENFAPAAPAAMCILLLSTFSVVILKMVYDS